MVRAAPARIIMTTPRPPWQLTTSELAREIEALEASPRKLPSADGEHDEERLAQLYAERDARKRLADHNVRAPARQFPDDASLPRMPGGRRVVTRNVGESAFLFPHSSAGDGRPPRLGHPAGRLGARPAGSACGD
jgi:hypothetical protein